jgi:Tfp pilus assembly protein PilF
MKRLTPYLLTLVLLGVSLTMGCASSNQSIDPVQISIPDQSAEISEAHQIAKRAQKTDSPEEAIALYRQAIETYRDLPPVWNNLGVLLINQHRYLDAAQAFVTASELSPADPRPLYNLGVTWERAGYLKDALRYYRKSLDRDFRYQQALRGAIHAERTLGMATEETLRRLKIALGQEQDDRWRMWFELQRPQVEAEIYSSHSSDDASKLN